MAEKKSKVTKAVKPAIPKKATASKGEPAPKKAVTPKAPKAVASAVAPKAAVKKPAAPKAKAAAAAATVDSLPGAGKPVSPTAVPAPAVAPVPAAPKPIAPATTAKTAIPKERVSAPTVLPPSGAPLSKPAPAKPVVVAPAPTVKPAPAATPAPQPAAQRPAPALPATPVKPAYSAPPQASRPVPTPPARPAAPPVAKPAPAPAAPAVPALKSIVLATPVTVRDLAAALEQKPTDLIARMIKMGTMASLNQFLQFEAAAKIAKEFGFELEEPHALEQDLSKIHERTTDASKLVPRAPIVTFMGHVDHGKTSLLDAIRKAKVKVVDTESGGITQHIGAYEIFTEKGAVTFLDTPGHEAFTAMRARGARCTDIVVLVVAADASIQPQTKEAIDHALAAEATIIVAINKCDLPSANIDRVKKDLAEHNLASEDWGGTIITVPVSAKTGQGIDQLVEMLLLEAELLELKADPSSPARGTVVEAELSRSSGPIATFLVQDGTLKMGDTVVCGNFYGKVRAMINEHGKRVPEAPPSAPVRVLGLSGVPSAGDVFYVVKDEVKAREWIQERLERDRNKNLAGPSHTTLDTLFAEIKAGKLQTLKLILKADVQGSVEALKVVLGQIPTNKVKLQIIHTSTGSVSHSDVMLAAASNAVIIGFHVEISPDAVEIAKREEVDVRLYQIIYEAKAAIEKALEGMLEPEKREVQIGSAEVLQVFKLSRSGVVAGSKVTKGKIIRNAICRVLRKGLKVHEGKVSGLKRFKNDAREVAEGFECGISVDNFSDFEPGDEIRVVEVEFKAQTLKS